MLHTNRQIKADAYMVYPGNPKKGNPAYLGMGRMVQDQIGAVLLRIQPLANDASRA